MCFSAEVRADYDAFRRLFPTATLQLRAFYDLYHRRSSHPKPPVRIPKAMDALVAQGGDDPLASVATLISQYNVELTRALEQDVFTQRKRLADAERVLQSKSTKKALEDQRIAGNKIKDALAKLSSIHRTEPRASDGRIFPGWYAPVLLIEDGQPVIRPMRYLCRPAGKPAFYDTKFPGLYNAFRA